ncbi:small hydrophobic protein [Streptomyces nigra]|uniref:small hydrophobic protein n=1 Tax=Streptomyces nigra TaxID=1827580 RepID=UPI00369280DE
MAGFGHGTRRHPRSRGRTWSRTGPDRATLGIVGAICAIAGFFVLGIILGPVAIVCGWLAMGAIDTLLAVIWLAGAATPGMGLA